MDRFVACRGICFGGVAGGTAAGLFMASPEAGQQFATALQRKAVETVGPVFGYGLETWGKMQQFKPHTEKGPVSTGPKAP